MTDAASLAQSRLTAISTWIDGSYPADLDHEAHLWRRVGKIAAEAGELHDAMSGMLGENPRKGVTHTIDDVVKEALDVATAALGAVEHITGNQGRAIGLLLNKIGFVHERAGLTATE